MRDCRSHVVSSSQFHRPVRGDSFNKAIGMPNPNGERVFDRDGFGRLTNIWKALEHNQQRPRGD